MANTWLRKGGAPASTTLSHALLMRELQGRWPVTGPLKSPAALQASFEHNRDCSDLLFYKINSIIKYAESPPSAFSPMSFILLSGETHAPPKEL